MSNKFLTEEQSGKLVPEAEAKQNEAAQNFSAWIAVTESCSISR